MKSVLFQADIMAFVGVLGCGVLMAQQDVRYYYDRAADFSKYKTFRWVDIEGGSHPDQLTDENIIQGIETILITKGLTGVDKDPADLYVGYQAAVNKEKQLNAYGGPEWQRTGGQITTLNISVGTLVLDIYDPAMKMLVWRGAITKTIDPEKNPEKNYEILQKGIAKLLQNYPPRQK